VPIKALAALDLAITVVPGADATKLIEVGVKGAAKAGGEQAAFALVAHYNDSCENGPHRANRSSSYL